MFVVFESEGKARERENDIRREEELGAARSIMANIYEGVPEVHGPDGGRRLIAVVAVDTCFVVSDRPHTVPPNGARPT